MIKEIRWKSNVGKKWLKFTDKIIKLKKPIKCVDCKKDIIYYKLEFRGIGNDDKDEFRGILCLNCALKKYNQSNEKYNKDEML